MGKSADDSADWDQFLAGLDVKAPPPADAGPAGRRAAALRPPGPRELTDEQAGIPSGLQADTSSTAAGPANRLRPATPQNTVGQAHELDPTAQMVAGSVLAGGAGKVMAPVFSKIGGMVGPAVSRALTRVGTGATEGEVGSDVQGGPPGVGALVGGALAAPGAALDIAQGAPARVAARTMKNITEDSVRAKTANQVEKAAGEHGENLAATLDRHPELRRALALKTKPGKVLEPVHETMDKLNGELDPAFEKMDAHAATMPPSAQATVGQLVDEYDLLGKRYGLDIEKVKAVQNAKKALLDTVGGDTSRVITPSELRTLKQGIGRAAFSGDPMTPGTVRAQVTRDLYGPVNAHIERMADATPGVDVDAFKNANKDMSVLIPVSQALEQRAAKLAEGKESVLHRIKDMGERLAYGVPAAVGLHSVLPEGMGYALGAGVAGLGARAAARTVDYYLAQLVKAGETGPVPVSMLQEAVKAGVPAQTALAAARGQLHLPSLGGTPATAESSPLPPALHAAIQNGDHVAGKQALAQAVFGP